jgi:hypothetical protein
MMPCGAKPSPPDRKTDRRGCPTPIMKCQSKAGIDILSGSGGKNADLTNHIVSYKDDTLAVDPQPAPNLQHFRPQEMTLDWP